MTLSGNSFGPNRRRISATCSLWFLLRKSDHYETRILQIWRRFATRWPVAFLTMSFHVQWSCCWLVVLSFDPPLIEIVVIVFVTNYKTTVDEAQCRYHVCLTQVKTCMHNVFAIYCQQHEYCPVCWYIHVRSIISIEKKMASPIIASCFLCKIKLRTKWVYTWQDSFSKSAGNIYISTGILHV